MIRAGALTPVRHCRACPPRLEFVDAGNKSGHDSPFEWRRPTRYDRILHEIAPASLHDLFTLPAQNRSRSLPRPVRGRLLMNVMVPIAASVRSERSEPVRRVSQGSAREIWEERRRAIERLGRSFTPEGSRSDWQSALFGYGAIAFECAARLLGFHGRGRRNALDPRLVEIAFSFPDLPPAFEGYRILHLSDTHFDCLPELAEIARALVSGLEVDLLALTGDIQGSKRAAFAESTAPLRRLIEAVRVTDRKLAVLGNHDPAAMAGVLRAFGLRGSAQPLGRRGARRPASRRDRPRRCASLLYAGCRSCPRRRTRRLPPRPRALGRDGRPRGRRGHFALSLRAYAWRTNLPPRWPADLHPAAALPFRRPRRVAPRSDGRLYQRRSRRRRRVVALQLSRRDRGDKLAPAQAGGMAVW